MPPPPDRERQALEEVAATRVSRTGALVLVGLSCLALLAGPLLEGAAAPAGFGRSQLLPRGPARLPTPVELLDIARQRGWRAAERRLERSFAKIEERAARNLVLARILRPPVQYLLTHGLGYGNGQIVAGAAPWLFFQEELAHVGGAPVRASSAGDPPRGDPYDARAGLAHLAAELAPRGIALVFVPVPAKATVHADQLWTRPPGDLARQPPENRGLGTLYRELERSGVAVFDSTRVLAAVAAERPAFGPSDSHWTPEGLDAAAAGLARFLERRFGTTQSGPEVRFLRTERKIEWLGDLARMLGFGALEARWPRHELRLRSVHWPDGAPLRPDAVRSELLLLGDSFSMIYSDDSFSAGNAGFAEQLSYHLRRPVERLANFTANALSDRERWLIQEDRLAGKRLVIYQVTVRSLSHNHWLSIPLAP